MGVIYYQADDGELKPLSEIKSIELNDKAFERIKQFEREDRYVRKIKMPEKPFTFECDLKFSIFEKDRVFLEFCGAKYWFALLSWQICGIKAGLSASKGKLIDALEL